MSLPLMYILQAQQTGSCSPDMQPLPLSVFPQQQQWQRWRKRRCQENGFPEHRRSPLTHFGRQLVSVTVATLDANETSAKQHLNDHSSLGPHRERLGSSQPILLPPLLFIQSQKAFSLFIRMLMEQKPERAPCLSTISCGNVFVALSCVSLEA